MTLKPECELMRSSSLNYSHLMTLSAEKSLSLSSAHSFSDLSAKRSQTKGFGFTLEVTPLRHFREQDVVFLIIALALHMRLHVHCLHFITNFTQTCIQSVSCYLQLDVNR
ncbi:hypothetical protein ILYODFUR_011865 [Ilyodon furcidens]|uniref:Uncharacterized protein n=1 Tax=Ilyodon furcidens TaxID=33524 RepID=A0ABV0U5R4_9TELE